LLRHFDALHTDLLGERAVIRGGKDAKLLAGLCETHSPERIKELMELFFQMPDAFVQENGYSVGMFISQVPKLIARSKVDRLPKAEDAPNQLRVQSRTGDTMQAARDSLQARLRRLG
jgi:hypothetical protein